MSWDPPPSSKTKLKSTFRLESIKVRVKLVEIVIIALLLPLVAALIKYTQREGIACNTQNIALHKIYHKSTCCCCDSAS